MTDLQPSIASDHLSGRSPWVWPAIMAALSVLALLGAQAASDWSELLYLIPYTFLGNSLAPLPYDGAVVFLGGRYALWLIVLVAILATLVIEAWNMELLGRLLAREGTRAFRSHHITQTSLRWYRKAPFWSLVATCVVPIIPHYPMRFLAVLAGYPLWKYQVSVILGRGARYVGLAGVGVAVEIPWHWIVLVSLVALGFGFRGARRMNRDQGGITSQPAIAEEV
ncbi:MAG TPA: VTT domain-containing protein [Gemmatimonadales bacterium]|nr:VTT domain-containing protein [Gemmatimonadales bacterium]